MLKKAPLTLVFACTGDVGASATKVITRLAAKNNEKGSESNANAISYIRTNIINSHNHQPYQPKSVIVSLVRKLDINKFLANFEKKTRLINYFPFPYEIWTENKKVAGKKLFNSSQEIPSG